MIGPVAGYHSEYKKCIHARRVRGNQRERDTSTEYEWHGRSDLIRFCVRNRRSTTLCLSKDREQVIILVLEFPSGMKVDTRSSGEPKEESESAPSGYSKIVNTYIRVSCSSSSRGMNGGVTSKRATLCQCTSLNQGCDMTSQAPRRFLLPIRASLSVHNNPEIKFTKVSLNMRSGH